MSPDFILQEFLFDASVCDDIIEYYQTSEKAPGLVYIADGAVVDKTVKDSVDAPLVGPVAELYYSQLQMVVDKYIEKYPQCNGNAPWQVLQAANIQKYDPSGGYFSWHSERVSADYPNTTRHLVFMTYLNDVTDGGETEFHFQGLKVRPKKGLTLIWPADWTHTHRGIPSPTQTKYIVTGWFNYV